MSMVMKRSLYLLPLWSPVYGWAQTAGEPGHPDCDTSSDVTPDPLHVPPCGGVGGLHGVLQEKVAGFPFGSRICRLFAPSPESKRLTRMVLPAWIGSICAR